MSFEFGIYPVITEEFCNGRSSIKVLKKVILGGAKIVQLREKSKTKSQIYHLAKEFREITKKNGVILIINDHIDIALAVNADGVHLGQDDLPCKVARKLAPDLIIGISTHNQEEILKAENDGASYINMGPIFSTQTKQNITPPLGIEFIQKAKTSLPFSVMGGIKKEHIPTLIQRGVKNIAMVTEITQSDNIEQIVKELCTFFN